MIELETIGVANKELSDAIRTEAESILSCRKKVLERIGVDIDDCLDSELEALEVSKSEPSEKRRIEDALYGLAKEYGNLCHTYKVMERIKEALDADELEMLNDLDIYQQDKLICAVRIGELGGEALLYPNKKIREVFKKLFFL